jgi:hypothetical protein
MVTLFNGYGLTDLFGDHHSGGMSLYMTRILATLLGTSYKKISLENEGGWTRTMYINGRGSGYLLGTAEQLARYTRYDMQIVTGDFRCHNCNEWYCVDDGNEANEFQGDTWCRGCYANRFAPCKACHQEFVRGSTDLVEVSRWSNDYCCTNCLPEHTRNCADCTELIWHPDRNSSGTVVIEVDGAERMLCRSCSQNYSRCYTCQSWQLYRTMNSIGYESYCDACAPAAQTAYEAERERRRVERERLYQERAARTPSPFGNPPARPATPPATGGLNWTVRIVDHNAQQPAQQEENTGEQE